MTPHLKSVQQMPEWLNRSFTIGQQIRQIREALNMTQDQLGKRSDLHQSVIAEIESGKRKDLCLSTIKKIASALNCKSFVQIIPQQKIKQILEARSIQVAEKIVRMSSASSAIEMQAPPQKLIDEQIKKIKKEVLEKRAGVLWRNL